MQRSERVVEVIVCYEPDLRRQAEALLRLSGQPGPETRTPESAETWAQLIPPVCGRRSITKEDIDDGSTSSPYCP